MSDTLKTNTMVYDYDFCAFYASLRSGQNRGLPDLVSPALAGPRTIGVIITMVLFIKCLTPFLLGTFFDFHDISAGHQDLAEQKTP